jgi:hypothetical protein
MTKENQAQTDPATAQRSGGCAHATCSASRVPTRLDGPIVDHTWDYDEDEGCERCERCGGKGYIVTCIDDMCRGADECMHGDGEMPCPSCGGQ